MKIFQINYIYIYITLGQHIPLHHSEATGVFWENNVNVLQKHIVLIKLLKNTPTCRI